MVAYRESSAIITKVLNAEISGRANYWQSSGRDIQSHFLPNVDEEEIRERLSEVRKSSSSDFMHLVRLAKLDPARHFRNCDWSGVSFRNCDLTGFDFTGSNLNATDFTGAKIRDTIFENNSTDGSNLQKILLRNSLTENVTQSAPGRQIVAPPSPTALSRKRQKHAKTKYSTKWAKELIAATLIGIVFVGFSGTFLQNVGRDDGIRHNLPQATEATRRNILESERGIVVVKKASRSAIRGESSDRSPIISASSEPESQNEPAFKTLIEPSFAPPVIMAAPELEHSDASASVRTASLDRVAPVTTTSSFYAFLGSSPDENAIRKELPILQSKYRGVLGNLPISFRAVNLGERRKYFHIIVGNLGSRQEALNFCQKIKSIGGEKACFVSR